MPWSSELGDVSETAQCHHNHRNHGCALPPRSDPCSWMSVVHGAPSGFAALLVGTGFVPIPRLRQRGVQFCRFSVRTPMRCMCRTWLQSGGGRGRQAVEAHSAGGVDEELVGHALRVVLAVLSVPRCGAATGSWGTRGTAKVATVLYLRGSNPYAVCPEENR